MLGARAILATEEDKSRAWRETGALAVDLESDVVARAADRPASRSWSPHDRRPVDRELPPAALIPLSEAGTPQPRPRARLEYCGGPGQIAT